MTSSDMHVYVGVDPGASGAVAVINGKLEVVDLLKLKDATDREVYAIMECAAHLGAKGFIERVHAMPKQGLSSTFKFGVSYGKLMMALAAAGVPYREVTPHKWQQSLGCLTKGDKNVTKRMAAQLFPDVKVTHAVADALLIAEYARRIWGGAS